MLANATKFFLGAMNELGLPNIGTRRLSLDSEATEKWTRSPNPGKSKSILLRHEDLKDKIDYKEINLNVISGKKKRSDALTKMFPGSTTRR
jgi:hypothetical protein